MKRLWSTGEDSLLRGNYRKVKPSIIAKEVGRTKNAVISRARAIGLAKPSRGKPSITIRCAVCGKEFKRRPSRVKLSEHQFCSRSCYYEKTKIVAHCENCGKELKRSPSKARATKHLFCSRGCYYEWKLGENSLWWKGGYESYYGPNWEQQRRNVLERDHHICQLCGAPENGREHDVHHIVPFREFGLKRYEEANRLENLATLCPSCHTKAETWDSMKDETHIALGGS